MREPISPVSPIFVCLVFSLICIGNGILWGQQQRYCPGLNLSLLRKEDSTAVLGSRLVGECFVESQIVTGHTVDISKSERVDNQVIRITQVTGQSDHGDIQWVITHSTAIRPTSGDEEFACRKTEQLTRQT